MLSEKLRKLLAFCLFSQVFFSSVLFAMPTFHPLTTADKDGVITAIDAQFLAVLEQLQVAMRLPYDISRVYKRLPRHPEQDKFAVFERDHFPRIIAPEADEALPVAGTPQFGPKYPGRVYTLLKGRTGAMRRGDGFLSGQEDVPGVVIYNPETKEIIVTFRGTNVLGDWNTNIAADAVSASDPSLLGLRSVRGFVHRGMALKASSYQRQLLETLRLILTSLNSEQRAQVRFYFVGHSLGAALAFLSAAVAAEFLQEHSDLLGFDEGEQFNNPIHNRILAYGVSVPRFVIGDDSVEQFHALLGLSNILRHNACGDPVTVAFPRRLGFRSLGRLAYQTDVGSVPTSTRALVLDVCAGGVRGVATSVRALADTMNGLADMARSFCLPLAERDRDLALNPRPGLSRGACMRALPALALLGMRRIPVAAALGCVYSVGRGVLTPMVSAVKGSHFAPSGTGFDPRLLDADVAGLLDAGTRHCRSRGRLIASAGSARPAMESDAPFIVSVSADGSQTFEHHMVDSDGHCGYSALQVAAQASAVPLAVGTRQALIESVTRYQLNSFEGAPVGLAEAVELAIHGGGFGSFEQWVAALDSGLWMGQGELNVSALLNSVAIHVHIYDQNGQVVLHPHMADGFNTGAAHHLNIIFVAHDEHGHTVFHGDPSTAAGLMHFDALLPLQTQVPVALAHHSTVARVLEAFMRGERRIQASVFLALAYLSQRIGRSPRSITQ